MEYSGCASRIRKLNFVFLTQATKKFQKCPYLPIKKTNKQKIQNRTLPKNKSLADLFKVF